MVILLNENGEWETYQNGKDRRRLVKEIENGQFCVVRNKKQEWISLKNENVTWKRAPPTTKVDGLENNFFVSDTAQFMARDETAQDSPGTQAQYYMINGQTYMVVPDAGQTSAYLPSYTTNYHYAGGQMW